MPEILSYQHPSTRRPVRDVSPLVCGLWMGLAIVLISCALAFYVSVNAYLATIGAGVLAGAIIAQWPAKRHFAKGLLIAIFVATVASIILMVRYGAIHPPQVL